MDLFDDKELVIVAVTVIAVLAIFRMPESDTIITSVVSGLFGVAVGKAGK